MTSHDIFIHGFKLKQYYLSIGLSHAQVQAHFMDYYDLGIKEKQDKIINEVLRKFQYPIL